MAEVSPRVNAARLAQYIGRTVRLTGKVVRVSVLLAGWGVLVGCLAHGGGRGRPKGIRPSFRLRMVERCL